MSLRGKSVLVTGYGFVGKHLVDSLLEQGMNVTVLERDLYVLQDLDTSKVDVIQSDILYLNKQLEFDFVIHTAGITNVRYSELNPVETYINNVVATLNLLRHVKVAERFIFTSSATVYDNIGNVALLDESAPLNPRSIYGLSKVAAEDLIRFYQKRYQLKFTIVRLFNLYGPYQSPFYIVPQVIRQMFVDSKIRIMNDKVIRDFLYIKDAASFFIKLMSSDKLINDVVNLGSGKGISIGELVNLIKKVAGKEDIPVEVEGRYDPASPLVLIANIDRAKSIGWSPTTSLEYGLKTTIDFYKRLWNL